jgi:hypothetical protein
MKLTEKDKQFLETLQRLMASHDLTVELRAGQPSYVVLRGTYGDKIHKAFGISRQGVRWRFQRLFDAYVSSFAAILFVERILGPQLRDHAVRISQERHALRQRLRESGLESADPLTFRRESPKSEQM